MARTAGLFFASVLVSEPKPGSAMKIPLLILLLLIPLPLTAQIYKSTDERGNVIYSDRPPPTGTAREEVELSPLNTAAPPAKISRPTAKPKDRAETMEYAVDIVSPANETTIPMGPGNFSVSAKVNPGSLGAGNSLQLQIDGEPWGAPQRSSAWQLSNIFRGAHDLTVSVVNSEGKTLTTSPPIRVYVMRPSSNFKNRN